MRSNFWAEFFSTIIFIGFGVYYFTQPTMHNTLGNFMTVAFSVGSLVQITRTIACYFEEKRNSGKMRWPEAFHTTMLIGLTIYYFTQFNTGSTLEYVMAIAFSVMSSIQIVRTILLYRKTNTHTTLRNQG